MIATLSSSALISIPFQSAVAALDWNAPAIAAVSSKVLIFMTRSSSRIGIIPCRSVAPCRRMFRTRRREGAIGHSRRRGTHKRDAARLEGAGGPLGVGHWKGGVKPFAHSVERAPCAVLAAGPGGAHRHRRNRLAHGQYLGKTGKSAR